jgi:hypothetical protein
LFPCHVYNLPQQTQPYTGDLKKKRS